jgi:hypothetical protein
MRPQRLKNPEIYPQIPLTSQVIQCLHGAGAFGGLHIDPEGLVGIDCVEQQPLLPSAAHVPPAYRI